MARAKRIGDMRTPASATMRRRTYNRWVADESMEDFALRFTARRARRWGYGRVANTALGSISFLALEAIGATITLAYGFDTAVAAIMLVGALIFLTGLPISYYAARYGVDIDLLSRGAGFGYVGSTITSLIYASFTFIFFAIEAAILALALEFCFGLPLAVGYILSSIIIIPIVMNGFRKLSAFQIATQPLWIVLHLVPFVFLFWIGIDLTVWTGFEGASGKEGLSLLMVAAASGMVFSLIAQIGEQVDFLRFLPEPRTASERRRWWAAMLAAGPGWSLLGVAKMLAGSLMATLLIAAAAAPGDAVDATRMYHHMYSLVIEQPFIALAITGLFVILSQLKINVTNAYAGSIAWSNFFSRVTHNHPGRVVWLVFNVAIATLLATLGILSVLEHVLTVYSHVALAWIGALTADLVINKRIGLSPEGIEFRRAHLHDVNPVGAGAMTLSVFVSFVAYGGLLGETIQVFSTFIALFTAFLLAPVIACLTKGRFYIVGDPTVISATPPINETHHSTQTCSVCQYRFDPEDMTHCAFYAAPICSLCCTLEGSCRDMCRPEGRLQTMTDRIKQRLLPQKMIDILGTQPARVMSWAAAPAGMVGLSLFVIRENAESENLNAILVVIFVISLVVIGVVIWSLILSRENREQALDDAELQTERLIQEIKAHEVTDRALQEAKEKAEEANLAKTRYMAGISHELRTPLNAVYGFAQILEADRSIPQNRVQAVRAIRRGAEHLAGLIENLLDIAKIEAGRLEIHRDIINFPALIDQVTLIFEDVAARKGIDFRISLSEDFPIWVHGDEKRLRQILINLLSNALRYTDAGSVHLEITYRNQVATIRVIDSGIGIAPDQIESIWRPFERAAKRGGDMSSGLGLTITKLLVEILGGEISVESTEHAGSTFQCKLMLPSILIDSALLGKLSISEFDPGALRYEGVQKRVLAIDDDCTHLKIIEALLTPIGFHLTSLQSAIAAQHVLMTEPIDIILLDIDMPGMNGWTLARWIRDQPGLRRLPIIMISGHALEAQCDGAGGRHNLVDAFFVKPYSLNDFLAKLSGLLRIEYMQRKAPISPEPKRWANPVIRPKLHLVALREAVENGHIAGIQNVMAQIRQGGHLPQEDLDRLSGHLERLDMNAMIRMLTDEPSFLDTRK